MQSLWLLGIWLAIMTIFLTDTRITLLFIGRGTDPAIRQEWAAVILLVPVITLLFSPLRAWAACAVAAGTLLHLCAHLSAYRGVSRQLVAAPPEAVEWVRVLAARWGLRDAPAVRLDPTDRIGPAVMGLRRHVLILTPSALELSGDEFACIVAHELAHVRRPPLLRPRPGAVGAPPGRGAKPGRPGAHRRCRTPAAPADQPRG